MFYQVYAVSPAQSLRIKSHTLADKLADIGDVDSENEVALFIFLKRNGIIKILGIRTVNGYYFFFS